MVIKVNKEVRERGLCRKLVDKGCGDIEVRIGDRRIISVKSVLVSCNDTLKKLIEDDEFEGFLELFEEISEFGFLEVEKYYSGGDLKVCRKNVCEILMFCLCYKDEDINMFCYKFLKNNIDDDVVIRLIHMTNIFPNCLRELEQLKMMEFEKRGYKYLYNDDYLMVLEMNNLDKLLSFKNLIIRSETWLLNRLIEWYIFKTNRNYDDNIFNKEFKSLIEDHIDGKMISENDLSDEMKDILKVVDIKYKKDINVEYIDLYKIKNMELQNLIISLFNKAIQKLIVNNYIENNKIEFKKEEKEVLNEVEDSYFDYIIFSLLEIDDIRTTEIVLMVMIFKNVNIENYIPNLKQHHIIKELCKEYNENHFNRTLKCLCLFIFDRINLTIINEICATETLFRILNCGYCLDDESKELVIEYVQDMKMNEEEEEEMSKIIEDEELLLDLKTKEITSFSYPYSYYLLMPNTEISITPSSFDGIRCDFVVNPRLPYGLEIDKEKGIIYGKVEDWCFKRDYKIACRNRFNEMSFHMVLEFKAIGFIELYKSTGILITNEGKLITNTINCDNHCYLNLVMKKGIYHIKLKYRKFRSNYNDMVLGLSIDNTYCGDGIYNQSTTCNYYAYGGKSIDITEYCHIGTVVNKNPHFNNKDASIYTMIVDMDKREFWLNHNNSDPVLLVKDLPSPLYPYACVLGNSSIELLLVTHEY